MSVYPKPAYRIGDILMETYYVPNSIPWYKDQKYVIRKYIPATMSYMITGTQDNYPRFYTKELLDCTFTIWRRAAQSR